MTYRITVDGVDGSTWQMETIGGREVGVMIAGEGLDGLVLEAEDVVQEMIGVPGQVLEELVIGKANGSLTVDVFDFETRSAGNVYRAFRAAWSRRDLSTLTVQRDGGVAYSAAVRLQESMPQPPSDPDRVHAIQGIEVSLVMDHGAWMEAEQSGTGTVQIVNDGMTPVWPAISWTGAGGPVRLPSGAVFTLPAASAPRTMLLDPMESLIVLDDAGVADEVLWPQVRAAAFSEGVFPGTSARFTVPSGASLKWRRGYESPWR